MTIDCIELSNLVLFVHIVVKNLRQLFDKYSVPRTEHDVQKYDEDFFKFCGLLRKPKLSKEIMINIIECFNFGTAFTLNLSAGRAEIATNYTAQ
jgi:hypothetical protein